MHQYWFVTLAKRSPLNLLLTAVVMWLSLVTVFFWLYDIPFELALQPTPRYLFDLGSALFFSTGVTYSICMGTYALGRSAKLIKKLSPSITMSVDQMSEFASSLESASTRDNIIFIGLGCLFGIAHTLMIEATFDISAIGLPRRMANIAGTMLIWITLFSVIWALIKNAHNYAKLGANNLKIDLIHLHKLTPMGNLALVPAMVLMPIQLMYPLLFLGGEFNPAIVIPGFFSTLFALFYTIFVVTWGLHQSITKEKTAALASINNQLKSPDFKLAASEQLVPRQLVEVQAIISHRTYLESVSGWPFNLASIAQLTAYIIFPPITWALAAIVSNFIDKVIA